MKSIPVTPLTAEAARRIVWFEEPEKALADPVRFMAYAMTYARHKDMQIIRQYVSDDEFRQALDSAPPGNGGANTARARDRDAQGQSGVFVSQFVTRSLRLPRPMTNESFRGIRS